MPPSALTETTDSTRGGHMVWQEIWQPTCLACPQGQVKTGKGAFILHPQGFIYTECGGYLTAFPEVRVTRSDVTCSSRNMNVFIRQNKDSP